LARLIFDGWDTGRINVSVRGARWIARGAILCIELTGGCVAHTEARGILDDDPGIEQTSEFEQAKYQQQ